MKKILSLILTTILALSVLPSLVACNPNEEPEGPVYSEEFVFDETHHWKPQINGEGDPIEYGEHVNAKTGKNVGKCKCGYYFPCHNLVYEKVTIDEIEGYKVIDYDEDISPNFYHVEVPKYYQGENDTEALPVLAVGKYALSNRNAPYGKCDVVLESIKLNEGIITLEEGAFCYSNIEEMIIPDSVKGDLIYTVMYCYNLKRAVVGNGVTSIYGYVFTGCTTLEELIIGNSVTEILPRNFIYVSTLKKVVLPASLVSIPETSLVGNTNEPEAQFVVFDGSNPDIFMYITEEELEALTIPMKERDEDGNFVNESDNQMTTYGFVRGWSGSSKIYFKDEWHYDSNGEPVPN